jgi:heterogeneous nuclear ribonucleoprotein L
MEIFKQKEIVPTAIRMFPLKSERSSSGLLEFSSIAQAVQAIMSANHTAIDSKGSLN